jgi:hypothetical protein
MVKISNFRIDLETARLERATIKYYAETVAVVDASASTTLDISTGNIFDLAHDINITTLTITNPSVSGNCTSITIIRTKDNSGTTRTITWPASFKWASGVAPTLTQSANAVDIITAFTKDGGTTWFAFAAGLNMS